MNQEIIAEAAEQLARSERGQQAMRDILSFLVNGAIGLDPKNRSAVLHLLFAAWGEYPGTVLEVLREGVFDGKGKLDLVKAL